MKFYVTCEQALYLGERSDPRVSLRVTLECTFYDVPQMESVLAVSNPLLLASLFSYRLHLLPPNRAPGKC